MTMEDVRARLKDEVAKEGSQGKFAKKHGLFKSQVQRVLRGDKPEPAVILALGLRRVVSYEERTSPA